MLNVKGRQLAQLRRSVRKEKRQRDNINVKQITGYDVGAVLKETRERKGWSQEDLAQESGISNCYISMIEKSRCNPTLFMLLTLSSSLQVPLSEILREAEGDG